MKRSNAASRRATAIAGVSAPSDRRFRRSEFNVDRRRVGRALVRAIKWTLPALALCAGGLWFVSVVLHARVLSVDHIVVRGNARLSTGEVQTLLDGLQGENIFQVDFEAYRRRLLDSPWVADVTLWRVLPATIEVRVVERSPTAIARLGHQLYLVDETGVVIDEYGAEYRDIDLPIVDGLMSSPSADGPLVDGDRMRLTNAFLDALGARPDLERRLSQVNVSRPHDVLVMFDTDPIWLHLGEDKFVERLRTYLELMPTLKDRFVGVDYVDLRFDQRVFVHSRGRTDVGLKEGR